MEGRAEATSETKSWLRCFHRLGNHKQIGTRFIELLGLRVQGSVVFTRSSYGFLGLRGREQDIPEPEAP